MPRALEDASHRKRVCPSRKTRKMYSDFHLAFRTMIVAIWEGGELGELGPFCVAVLRGASRVQRLMMESATFSNPGVARVARQLPSIKTHQCHQQPEGRNKKMRSLRRGASVCSRRDEFRKRLLMDGITPAHIQVAVQRVANGRFGEFGGCALSLRVCHDCCVVRHAGEHGSGSLSSLIALLKSSEDGRLFQRGQGASSWGRRSVM